MFQKISEGLPSKSMLDEKTLVNLKEAARRKIVDIDSCDEDGACDDDADYPTSLDDAYSRGLLDGEAELARTILTAIGETW